MHVLMYVCVEPNTVSCMFVFVDPERQRPEVNLTNLNFRASHECLYKRVFSFFVNEGKKSTAMEK